MNNLRLLLAILLASPFLVSFVYGLRTGRAWIKPRIPSGQRRARWVDRYREPFWFWGAMVAYLAATGWILFFALWQP